MLGPKGVRLGEVQLTVAQTDMTNAQQKNKTSIYSEQKSEKEKSEKYCQTQLLNSVQRLHRTRFVYSLKAKKNNKVLLLYLQKTLTLFLLLKHLRTSLNSRR